MRIGTLIMGFGFLGVVLSLLTVTQTAAGQATARYLKRSARVKVIAFDTEGRYLGPPLVRAFESDDRVNLASKFRRGAATNIPFGVYRIEGFLTGYTSETRFVRIYQPQTVVVLGLTVGYELPEVPPILEGSIVGRLPADKKVFARLVGLYSNVAMESMISSDGTFAFGGLTDGRYLLLVIGEHGILASRNIRIPYTGAALQIELDRDSAVTPR
jgi:hypothetical protein